MRASTGRATVDWWLGIAVLGAPLAWAAQLTLGYGAEEAACGTGSRRSGEVYGLALAPFEVGLTVALLAVALACAVISSARLRSLPEGDDARTVRRRVAAGTGIAGGVLFSALIAFGGIASVAFDACST